ncbi:MAG: 4Fe-4S dicluster domain-containing protein [Chloroflexota bacterium]
MSNVKRYGFVIDPARCIDCRACLVACRAQWQVPTGKTRIWVHTNGVQGEYPTLSQQFVPFQCQHCTDAPCITACPTGATYRREDGLVMIDEEACIGCGLCINACPYEARFLNEEKGVAEKCNGCYTRVDRGELPACVATCVGGARLFGDLNDPESEVSKAIQSKPVTRLINDVDTQPNVFYLQPVEANNPSWPHAKEPTPAETFWQKVAVPGTKLAIGAAVLGQAIAFAKQLWGGESEFEE